MPLGGDLDAPNVGRRGGIQLRPHLFGVKSGEEQQANPTKAKRLFGQVMVLLGPPVGLVQIKKRLETGGAKRIAKFIIEAF